MMTDVGRRRRYAMAFDDADELGTDERSKAVSDGVGGSGTCVTTRKQDSATDLTVRTHRA